MSCREVTRVALPHPTGQPVELGQAGNRSKRGKELAEGNRLQGGGWKAGVEDKVAADGKGCLKSKQMYGSGGSDSTYVKTKARQMRAIPRTGRAHGSLDRGQTLRRFPAFLQRGNAVSISAGKARQTLRRARWEDWAVKAGWRGHQAASNRILLRKR